MSITMRGLTGMIVSALGAVTVLLAGMSPRAAAAANLQSGLLPSLDQALSISYNGNSLGVYAGPFSTTLDGGKPFDAYCVDLDHWDTNPAIFSVTPKSTNLLTTGTGTPANGPEIAWLYNTYAGGVTNSTQGAALQLAIWDVLTDNGDGFSAGNFRFTTSGATLNQANTYLHSWTNQSSTATWLVADNHGTDGHRYQNLIGPTLTPEPTSLALLAIGGLPLLALRRRKLSDPS